VYWGSQSHLGSSVPVAGVLGMLVLLLASIEPARALPSYARQTGQPCGTCHTDFPALTPYGRRFKLLGYTTGGGPYRTTPFSRAPTIDAGSEVNDLADYAKGNPPPGNPDKVWVPPISVMAIEGYTHTQAPLAPPTAPYGPNDNWVLAPFSFFVAGAVTEHIGTFTQITYSSAQGGGAWSWDNTDIRYADVRTIGGVEVIYGITANNNPTVQDVWNTTPAWTFPYAISTLAPTPAAHTLIDGTFAAHVGSTGVYTYINNMLYLEASAYRTLDPGAQQFLGVSAFDTPGLFEGAAPYWRLAFEPHWREHWLMLGTFGMFAKVHPFVDPSGASGATTLPQGDSYTDLGYDAQYQYQGSHFWLTLRGSYIREFQKLDATFSNGGASNPSDTLNTLRLQGSLAIGGDNRIVLTGQHFGTWGTADPLLYAGLASGVSPNSNGWIAEIAYIPFGSSFAPGWPWANARIGLQYTWYDKFDGTTLGAHSNDTLFLHAWLAF